MKRGGFVALMGRPNAGKSTLMNALVGRKLAAVSRKPQTTRNHILGIVTTGNTQLVFVDTPGIHALKKRSSRMNSAMNKEAWRGGGDADLVIYLISSSAGWQPEDGHNIARLLQTVPDKLQIYLSQVDRHSKSKMTSMVKTIKDELSEITKPTNAKSVRDVFTVTAKHPESVGVFRSKLQSLVPEVPQFFFPEDQASNRPTTFYCAELIREQVFRQLGQEIPYQCGVLIEDYEDRGTLAFLQAKVISAKEHHKGMIVGRGGSRIKEIGVASRQALQEFLGQKVHLELRVTVDRDWLNRPQAIQEIAGLI